MSPQFPADDPYAQQRAQEMARQIGGKVREVNRNNVFYGYDVEGGARSVARARKKAASR